MKTCTACDEAKPLESFPTTLVKGSTYHRSICRDCKRAQDRDYAARNSARRKKTARAWQLRNHEYYLAYLRAWHQKQPKPTDITSETLA